MCVLFVLLSEIRCPTNLDQHHLHLVRNLIALFLFAACSVVVYLVDTDADPFHSKEIALLRMLSGTAAPSAALERLLVDPCVRSASTLFMFRVSISYCNPNLA